MDFELDQQQQAIIDAVSSLLERSAGAARAIELAANGEYDAKLHDELLLDVLETNIFTSGKGGHR